MKIWPPRLHREAGLYPLDVVALIVTVSVVVALVWWVV